MSEDELTKMTQKKYPDAQAFAKDMPRMLRYLGFPAHDAKYIAERIVVEPARGSGHAWGAQGRWEPARLRTRIGDKGMDYKGYNIAVHEFGHNVEQTLDLYDIDYYMLNGVPNTAFTEALAFIFQKRDLELLGFDYKLDDNTTLDIFWGAYEIMGVALTDMYTWQWLYAHPEATAVTRWYPSPRTYGTSTTPPSSALPTVPCWPSTLTWSTPRCTCPTTPSGTSSNTSLRTIWPSAATDWNSPRSSAASTPSAA